MTTPKINAFFKDAFDVDPDDYANGKPGALAANAPPPDASPSSSAATGALAASADGVFFELDSSDLTASDKTTLDAYAAAYLAANAGGTITVEGFASVDGDAGHNQSLSVSRAQAVQVYLIGKGVPKDKISASGKGPTTKFDAKNAQSNRRATLAPPAPAPVNTPAPAPGGPPATAGKSPDDLFALGRKDGAAGVKIAPPADADKAGVEAYNRGYGAGIVDRTKADLLTRLRADLKAHRDPKAEMDELGMLDLDAILDVVEALNKSGELDDFAGVLTGDHSRIGTAVLTVTKDYGANWQNLVAKLGQDDRDAVLKRVPPGTYTGATGENKDGKAVSDGDDGSPVTVGVMFVPKTVHKGVVNASGTSTDPGQVQVSGQYTFKFHKDGKNGFEFSPVAQASFMWDETHQKMIGQPMLGGQAAFVEFLNPIVQVQEFAQLLDGATIEVGKPINSSISTKTQATEQVAVGVQAVITIWGKHLQLVVQAQGSSTATGKAITVDASAGIGLQWAF